MLAGYIDNQQFHKNLGDTCISSKGSSSIVIKDGKMVVNTLDNMINCYDMNNIIEKPPVRLYGHKSSKEFYGMFALLLKNIYSSSYNWVSQ